MQSHFQVAGKGLGGCFKLGQLRKDWLLQENSFASQKSHVCIVWWFQASCLAESYKKLLIFHSSPLLSIFTEKISILLVSGFFSPYSVAMTL